MTISALAKNAEDSAIKVNWGPGCMNPPQWIGIHNSFPMTSTDHLLSAYQTKNESMGCFTTSIKLGKFDLPTISTLAANVNVNTNTFDHENKRCFSYFAGGYDGENLETLTCLSAAPNWMHSMPNLKQIPLKNIFIPGIIIVVLSKHKSYI